MALRAGFIPPQIVFTGVGKTSTELAQAIELGVRTINVESAGEMERIDALSRERQTRTKIALRVNPDIDARSHPHISTGLKSNKFGIAIGDVPELARRARGLDGVEIVGLHSHVGSQIVNLDPLRRAAAALVDLSRALRDEGIRIEHLDLGGGLGVSYDGTAVPSAREYADALLPAVRELRTADHSRAGPPHHGARGRAADARHRRQGAGRRPAVRDHGCRHDRDHPADAVQRVPPDRAGDRVERAAGALRHRRAALREQRRARHAIGRSRSRPSTSCMRCWTRAPTAR